MNKKILIMVALLSIVVLSGCGNTLEVRIRKEGIGNTSCSYFCVNYIDDTGGMKIKDGQIKGCWCECYSNIIEREYYYECKPKPELSCN